MLRSVTQPESRWGYRKYTGFQLRTLMRRHPFWSKWYQISPNTIVNMNVTPGSSRHSPSVMNHHTTYNKELTRTRINQILLSIALLDFWYMNNMTWHDLNARRAASHKTNELTQGDRHPSKSANSTVSQTAAQWIHPPSSAKAPKPRECTSCRGCKR